MKIANILISGVWGEVSPAALEKGIGGREGALIYLSREWAKQGHEVTNFVNVEEGKRFYEDSFPGMEDDGFHEYVPLNLTRPMLANFPWDVAIAWECPSTFEDHRILNNVKLKICEMQVCHFSTVEMLAAENYCDYVAALSPWHKNFLLHQGLEMDEDEVVVFPNGVDISRYPEENIVYGFDIDKDPMFIYSSSPDRGLWHILEIWPELRKDFPEAKLLVGYGAQKWIDYNKWSHGRQGEMAVEIERLMKQPGVKDIGKIGQQELSNYQLMADAWLYPLDAMNATESGCFAADTLVDCPRDHRKYPRGIPISEIKAGQLVWSYSEAREKFELKRVTKSWLTKKNAPIYKVTLNTGEVIRGTEEHPFLLRDGTWKALKDLQPNDSLLSFERDFDPLVRIRPNGGALTQESTLVSYELGKTKGDGLVAHHKDETRMNSSEDNIEVITPKEHALKHKISWDRINKKLTKWEKEKRDKRVAKFAKSRWNQYTKGEETKMIYHATHPSHRCKKPCVVCFNMWNYVPPMPEIKPGPGGKTARYHWTRLCEQAGIPNHKVISIEFDGYEDVYNLEVEDNHTYIVAGVVVHNCITAVENAAAGNPIITTDCDCMATEFGRIGRIVDMPWNPEAFYSAIRDVLIDEVYYISLQKKGRQFAESRDWSLIANKWLQLFKQHV